MDYPSTLAKSGAFVRLPIITGANSEEGQSFASRTVQSDAEIASWLLKWRDYQLRPNSIQKLINIYEPYAWPPYHISKNATIPGTGKAYRKSGAIGGDLVMIAQRRKVAQQWTGVGEKVWSFRFDTPLWDSKETDGTKHGDEVVFTFQNITGNLGPLPQFEHYKRVSEGIGQAYINSVNRRDPNPLVNMQQGRPILPYWHSYGDRPVNMVFDAKNVHVEMDDWREEGITFANSISREILA
jgi:carboxylesterase type B